MYDFSNVQLRFNEKFKLFLMRFKKHVSEKFLGKATLSLCLSYKFIVGEYHFVDTRAVRDEDVQPTLYHLTDKYYRYCIYRRQKFFDKAIWPIIVSIVTSIITSLIASYFVSRQVADQVSIQGIEELLERLL